MKKSLQIIVVAALLVATPMFAQSEWTIIDNPSTMMRDLYSITVTPSGHVHAVGAYGEYIRDNGSGLEAMPDLGGIEYKKVIAIDDNILYTCGENEIIKKSTDGGDNWVESNSYNADHNLNDLDFWSPDSGIAVGSDGLVLRTTDGGDNWTQINITTNPWFQAISTDSNGIAIAVAGYGTILRSTNFGETWEQITSPVSSHLYGIDLTDSGIGVIVGKYGVILRSTNFGETWEQITSPVSSHLHAISIVNNGSGVAVGDNGIILNTTDNGATWVNMNNETSEWLIDVSLLDDNTAWAVGNNGVILYNSQIPLSIKVIDNQIPDSYNLSQNYPNPFNPSTTINYSIPTNSTVNLTVYNALGQTVDQVVSEFQSAGAYQAVWDAETQPSGMYFYQLKAGEFTQTRKMLLVK